VVAVAFPSLEFFQTLQPEAAAERERFSRLGYFDTTFGIRILQDGGAADFTVAFEVFDCVRVVDGIEPEVDFVIEGPLAAWKEMLDNVHALGAADTEHSLNTLTHFGERLTVRYDDPAQIYPHVYGPIDRAAIVGVLTMPRDASGAYLSPA